MLVNCKLKTQDPILSMVALVNGNSDEVVNTAVGVYTIGSFNFDLMIDNEFKEYPILSTVESYGVCDDLDNLISKEPDLINDKDRYFCVALTPVLKSNQSKVGGWRWHKWGEYIGSQTPTTEYLYDEEKIDKVFVYHIYELTNALEDK